VIRASVLSVILGGGGLVGCQTITPYERGIAAKNNGEHRQAADHFRRAIASGQRVDDSRTQLEEALLSLAHAQLETDIDRARALYEDVLRINASSREGAMGLGRSYMKLGRYDEAIELLAGQERCRGCRTLLGVVHDRRGQRRVGEGDFDAARDDFGHAYRLTKDPMIALRVVDIYIVGGHGSAEAALNDLERALRLTDGSPSGQRGFYEARRKIVLKAARLGDEQGLGKALSLPDPRTNVLPDQRSLDEIRLRMQVAKAKIHAGETEEGMRFAAQILVDARTILDDEGIAVAMAEFVDVARVRAAAQIASGAGGLARSGIRAIRKMVPRDRVLALQEVLALAIQNRKSAIVLLEALPHSWKGWPETRAQIHVLRSQEYAREGQYTAARSVLARAQALAPQRLEVHLAAAQLLARTRYPGLLRTDAQRFRELGEFSYPSGVVGNQGQALAEIEWIKHQVDESAHEDRLRGPAFFTDLEELERELRSFYPYRVEVRSSAMLELHSESGGQKITLLMGKRREQITLEAGGAYAQTFGGPSFVRIHSGTREIGLFVEPNTLIHVEL